MTRTPGGAMVGLHHQLSGAAALETPDPRHREVTPDASHSVSAMAIPRSLLPAQNHREMTMNDATIMPTLAPAIREARIRSTLTQQELAWACGVHRSTIGRIENGRLQPGFRLVARIAAVTGASLDEMLTGAR